jgi:hypothetical protein
MLASNQTIRRGVGAVLFIIGGGALALISLFAGPSLWYVLCFSTLPIVGIIWIWRPPLAASLSIGPLISVCALLVYASGMWAISRVWAGAVVVGLTTAIVLVITAVYGFPGWRLPVVLSLIFVSITFATDRLFTNQVAIHSYQMYVALNGHAPWGDVGPESPNGSAPIVLYRRVGNSYCYDAFQSEELRQRLAPKDGYTTTVEYNIFSDFGKERSYNVRSVDGLLLANGQHTVRDFERFGGQILGNGYDSHDGCR